MSHCLKPYDEWKRDYDAWDREHHASERSATIQKLKERNERNQARRAKWQVQDPNTK